jgi:hypothetical protein
MEKDGIAAGTLEPLVELDGEVEARRQVGELTGKGHFPAVQVEGNAHLIIQPHFVMRPGVAVG